MQPSDSPTDGPDKPLRPDLITEPTEKGAIATAEYFLDLEDYASQTNDWQDLEALTSKKCKYCASVIEEIRTWEAAGQRLEGGRAIRSEGALVVDPDGAEVGPGNLTEAVIYFTVEDTPGVLRDYEGEEVRSYRADMLALRVTVVYQQDSWRIGEVHGLPL